MSNAWVAVIGTRAQLVKMAPVLLAAENEGQKIYVVLTGQHKETMNELAQDLGVSHFIPEGEFSSEKSTVMKLLTWIPVALFKCLSRIELISRDTSIDWVLVHGDTVSTLIGAAAARLKGYRVAHIESGLTSFKVFNPLPEEIIRRLVGRMAFASLCPDSKSAERMMEIDVPLVVNTEGNSIIDALKNSISQSVDNPGKTEHSIIVSIHRFENIMSATRLNTLVNVICNLSENFKIYLILHPPTYKRLIATGLLEKLKSHGNIVLQQRINYSRFMALVSGAEIVLTDGGSNQEELAILGIPTILMRSYTERSDGLEGNVIFEGSVEVDLITYINSGRYLELKRNRNIAFGSSPSKIIVESLASYPKSQDRR